MGARHNSNKSKNKTDQKTDADKPPVSPEAATRQAGGQPTETPVVESQPDAPAPNTPPPAAASASAGLAPVPEGATAEQTTEGNTEDIDPAQLEVDYVEMGNLQQQVAELQESVTMYMAVNDQQKAAIGKLQTDFKVVNTENQRLKDSLSGSTDATSGEIATLRAEYRTLQKKSEDIPNLEKTIKVLRQQNQQLKSMEQVFESDDKPIVLRSFSNAAELKVMQEYALPVQGTEDEYSFFIVGQGQGIVLKNKTKGTEKYYDNLQPFMRVNHREGTSVLELTKIVLNVYS